MCLQSKQCDSSNVLFYQNMCLIRGRAKLYANVNVSMDVGVAEQLRLNHSHTLVNHLKTDADKIKRTT